jgi:hypothetical protein
VKISILLAVSVFALSAFAQTGDAIFSQTYSFAELENAFQSASIADDFVPYQSGDIQHVVLWMIFTGTPPVDIFVEVSEDNGDVDPNTATSLVSGNIALSIVATGDSLSGYSIDEVTLTLPMTISVMAGERYWLEVGTVAGSYWAYQEPVVFGTSMWNYTAGQYHEMSEAGDNYDSFFEIRTPVALQRSSWGSIKASF